MRRRCCWPAATKALAERFGVAEWAVGIERCLACPDIDAMIRATSTPLHAAQAVQCLEAGEPVLVEILLADSLADAERVMETAARTGLIAMASHTRCFNPSHQ
jgi:2-hydroxy-4-carboxymuconate semialdehyde hemiacetal dehydrogenase